MADPIEAAEVTRADRFIKTAVAILGETGRTDFTVQEVVARSKTSLRAFYQHFSSKDELLLALFDRTIAQSVRAWRSETNGLDSTAALKLVIDRVSQQPESSTQDSLNRALSLYNQHLAETRPREYARVLSPLHQLIRDIVGQGITEGVFNPGLDVGAAASIGVPFNSLPSQCNRCAPTTVCMTIAAAAPTSSPGLNTPSVMPCPTMSRIS